MIDIRPLWIFGLLSWAAVVMGITTPQLETSQQSITHSGQAALNGQEEEHNVHVTTKPQVFGIHSNAVTDEKSVTAATLTTNHLYQHLPSRPQTDATQAHVRPEANFLHDHHKNDVLTEIYKQQQQQQQQQFQHDNDLNDPYRISNSPAQASFYLKSLPASRLYDDLLMPPFHNGMMAPRPIASLSSLLSTASIASIASIVPSMLSMSITPRYPAMLTYTQSVRDMFITYPFYIPNDNRNILYDDHNLQGILVNRQMRPSFDHNSPIYYVRIAPAAPAPYVLFPNLNVIPYHSPIAASLPVLSSIFNIPINFLANGKPFDIYQMGGSPDDIQGGDDDNSMIIPRSQFENEQDYNLLTSPSQAHSSFIRNYLNLFERSSKSNAQSNNNGDTQSFQDSKLTNLKRPYYFNGHPEDIYVLRNTIKSAHLRDNNYY